MAGQKAYTHTPRAKWVPLVEKCRSEDAFLAREWSNRKWLIQLDQGNNCYHCRVSQPEVRGFDSRAWWTFRHEILSEVEFNRYQEENSYGRLLWYVVLRGFYNQYLTNTRVCPNKRVTDCARYFLPLSSPILRHYNPLHYHTRETNRKLVRDGAVPISWKYLKGKSRKRTWNVVPDFRFQRGRNRHNMKYTYETMTTIISLGNTK